VHGISVKNNRPDAGGVRQSALPWTEVPLFAPALAVLASAVVAVSAVALLTPAKNQAVEIVLPLPAMAPQPTIVAAQPPALAAEPPAMPAELPAVAAGLYEMAPAAPVLTAEAVAKPGRGAANAASPRRAKSAPLTKMDGNPPADGGRKFRQAKAAGESANFMAIKNILAKNIVPVSLEPHGDMTPKIAVPAVFNASIGDTSIGDTSFGDTSFGDSGFLPAPIKPRLFDDSIASAAIKLPLPRPSGKAPQDGQIGSVAALDAHFERIDYDLANVRNSENNVPRLYLDKLPADIADVSSVATRKRIFIKSVLPVILRVNEDILAARHKLKKLRATLDSGMSLSDEQRQWLYQMAERYETNPYDWDAFMARVDIVPPSLAIAQAAEESGWGTSRFAREGNALFGQYTYKSANGILPEERANGRRHLIRAYSSLVEGVRSYMHNLNYHRAYGKFRAARKWLRAHAKPMDGHTLAGELIRYSERGAAYVKTIRRIIRANKLAPLDDARLHNDRWTRDEPVAPGRQS
jgi:Bax protein